MAGAVEGMQVTGVAAVTISRGRVVYENGVLTTVPGSGKFVPRSCFGSAYDNIERRDKAADPRQFKVERKPYDGPVVQI